MKTLSRFLTDFIPKKGSSEEKKNYCEYIPTHKELAAYYAVSSAVMFSVFFLFYRSLYVSFFSILLSIPGFRLYSDYKTERQKESLLDEFRDVLYSVSSSVAAGRQMPSALEDASSSLKGDMKAELESMLSAYRENHADLGELLGDLGRRSGLAEIKQFSDSYGICKKCGADLEAVCLKSASLLLDRIEYQSEVKMLVSQKKLDILLLTAMPVAVLLFLNLIAKSYISVLYTSILGRLTMSVCLLLIGSALVWGMKITDLKL